ncbi:hypothetical protein HO173_009838 [Letharia columbiana]|uniref:Uncharacterized protein n=1 Tax=Letharia columbiana TaxID=112416 RepID=A0A8H6FNX6_9LECA|nr:uncharacterized protein HO173_009838 [Letharia columbiana]KAF6232001.1 hypothetical protein HO173_009838 [Letharia columbiana]
MLLDKGADININTQGGLYDNALCAASQRGYEKVVQMLLDKEADFDAQNGYYGNALCCVASRGGYEKVVQMLLKTKRLILIFRVNIMAMLSTQRHKKVMRKWCRCC